MGIDPAILKAAVDAVAAANGNVRQAARALNVPRSTLRDRLAQAQPGLVPVLTDSHPWRIEMEIDTGTVLVAGDAHYWPDIVTTIHKAFVRACGELNPVAVIMNGDVFDGASVSRHASIGWEGRPTVVAELEACQARLKEIAAASVKSKARRLWNLGNHDGRYESRLAAVAPEYARVHGVHLKDHFPEWEPAWSTWINGGDDTVVVKHRLKGGTHATYNNVKAAGTHIVTNHLHQGKCTPVANYRGSFWGVDTGTLCEPPWYQAINYLEDAPVDWHSSFAVLTFHKGRLLTPELVYHFAPGQVEWRGKVYSV